MTQQITKGIGKLMAEAKSAVKFMSIEDAMEQLNNDDFVFVDLRDPDEQERNGVIPGSFTCPRGMMEFWIDPSCPVHKPVFAQDKTFIFYCATGWRSAFSAKLAAEMGLLPVVNLDGGIAAWKSSGGEVEWPNGNQPLTRATE